MNPERNLQGDGCKGQRCPLYLPSHRCLPASHVSYTVMGSQGSAASAPPTAVPPSDWSHSDLLILMPPSGLNPSLLGLSTSYYGRPARSFGLAFSLPVAVAPGTIYSCFAYTYSTLTDCPRRLRNIPGTHPLQVTSTLGCFLPAAAVSLVRCHAASCRPARPAP